MRLLFVTNGLGFGGAERIVETLAVHFHAQGNQVQVVAVTRDGPIGDRLRELGVEVNVLGIRSPLDARAPLELVRVARSSVPELIHSHLEVSDITVAMASPALRSTKTITTIHNLGLGALASSRWKRALWRVAVPRFDRVLAVSAAVADMAPVEATVVHPSVLSKDAPLPDRSRMRRSLGVAEDVPLVLGVGRLSREKGFDLLGRASEQLVLLGARVLLIGDGPERDRLLRHPHLELIGPRSNVRELMAAADVVVCPSRTEGFPQAPLEAMFAGVPVVATAVGGTVEILEGDSGVLVPPEDPDALSAAIAGLLSAPEAARRLGARGRERIFEAGFTAEAMCARHQTIYRELL